MPIYEETYRPWNGILEQKPRTWLVIARTGIHLVWKKGMVLLLLFALIPFFVRAVQIFAMTKFGNQAEIAQLVKVFEINPKFFESFLRSRNFFYSVGFQLLLVILYSGAGLIANDRKYNALQIYFSKSVSIWDYITGKFLIILFYGSLVTLVPGLLLFIIQILLARDAVFLQTYYWIPVSFTAYVFLILIVLGGLILTLSAVAGSAGSAAVFFFALIIFPDLFRQILSRVPEAGLISLNADIKQVGSLLFDLDKPYDFSVWLGFFVLLIIVILCVVILRKKVRPTEIIK